jgi:four helix bundle protein
MTPQKLRLRTGEFAVRARRFCEPLLRDIDTVDPARQLARASAAVAANYRATGVARTRKEFVARIGVVLEETDESAFWCRYLKETGLQSAELDATFDEAHQLAKIFNASFHTARERYRKQMTGPRTR